MTKDQQRRIASVTRALEKLSSPNSERRVEVWKRKVSPVLKELLSFEHMVSGGKGLGWLDREQVLHLQEMADELQMAIKKL